MLQFIFLTIVALLGLLAGAIFGAQWLACRFGGDLSAWVQSVGAILAIVTGFAAAIWQVKAQRLSIRAEQHAVARAAHILTFEALSTVNGRLEAALMPAGTGKVLRLQGDRATEMVLAMREFDTAKLPADLLPPFVGIRSHAYAVNQRISNVYESEEKDENRRKDREKRLVSAVRVHNDAVKLFAAFDEAAAKFGAQPKKVEPGANTDRVAQETHV